MDDIIIYGTGGMARETVQLIEDINAVKPRWNIAGFIDDFRGDCGESVSGYAILGGNGILERYGEGTYVVIALGDPSSKRSVYEKTQKYKLKYPVLIHPTAVVAPSAVIGEGSIIGIQCVVSVNAVLGRHVLLNTKSFAAHDSVIGDFSSCYVNCMVNGGVSVGEGVLIGSGSVIMERRKIGSFAKISMGSVVVSDVGEGHVVMTKPSRSMLFVNPD
jgi:sugar O-acyltransferase (sialic acid O-acetyltransferase NeuD family)